MPQAMANNLPNWMGRLAAAINRTVAHPMQQAGAATTPGPHVSGLQQEGDGEAEPCRQENITFIPPVAGSLDGWHT